eukprot:7023052-Prymnesium_polylepis.1
MGFKRRENWGSASGRGRGAWTTAGRRRDKHTWWASAAAMRAAAHAEVGEEQLGISMVMRGEC